MKKLKAIIIGAGNIGAFYDNPDSENILTHAHAYTNHQGFELVGFVDSDLNKAKEAAHIWKCRYFPNIKTALESEQIDIVSVCVPDDLHYEVLKRLTQTPIKLIFAEKPITKTATEAQKIINLCDKKRIDLQINYSRRFIPEFIKLKQKIKNNNFGKFVSGTGFYGKGILHNGSHIIDLIRNLIGEIGSATLINKLNDHFTDDPSVAAIIKMQNGKNIALMAIDCQNYTIFELDLLFEKGRVLISDSGRVIKEYKVTDSSIFKDYKFLTQDQETITSLDKSISSAVENIYNHLLNGQSLLCQGKEALQNLETANNIKQAPPI